MTRRFRSRVRNRGRIPRSYYTIPFQDTFIDYTPKQVPPTKHEQGDTRNRKRTREEMEEYWQSLRDRTKSLRQKTGHVLAKGAKSVASHWKQELEEVAFAAAVSFLFGPVAGVAAGAEVAEIEMGAMEGTSLLRSERVVNYGL
jgi:hypothetical protein